MKLTRAAALKKIYETNGKIFSVKFIKRTTGELRKMNCRLGVTKHLMGGELKYDRAANHLIGVYDLQSKGYRSIAIEGLTELNGEEVVD